MDWPSGPRHVVGLNDLIKYDWPIGREERAKCTADIGRQDLATGWYWHELGSWHPHLNGSGGY